MVRVRDLGKTYRVFASPWHRLLEAVTRRPHHVAFRALEGVSFELPAGESLGIVGENGAGKSTLLKLLAGVSAPSRGSIDVRGRISSILELGSGFHPDFTGRQNIRINAALLGLPEARVEEKIPEIVAFAELGDFIDRPVKSYSTGMAMRLAFAIATEVEPDVLIIDEALSVGDGYFQKKCMDRMVWLTDRGTTLLFCTHAMYYLTAFCHQALWLRDGSLEALGPAREVVASYESYLLRKSSQRREHSDLAQLPELEGGPARLTRVEARPSGRPLALGDSWCLDLEWESQEEQFCFHLGVGLDREDGVQVTSISSQRDGLEPFTGQLEYRASLEIPALPVLQGEFTVYVYLLDEAGLHVYDQEIVRGGLSVRANRYRTGLLDAEHHWRMEDTLLPPGTPEALPGRGVTGSVESEPEDSERAELA